MTEHELESAIARHEMQRLELKESFGSECVETAAAFANADGGYIVIGVDNAGDPSSRQLRFEALRDYENSIATSTEPVVCADAEKVAFRGREVVVLRIQENPLKPVACKGRCYVRKGSVNHQMTPAEIAEAHLKSTGSGMDAVFVPGATRGDLDMNAVRQYMQKAVSEHRRDFTDGEDPWRTLVKLGWVKSENEITRAAYLLFAKNPQLKFPQAIVHSGAFKCEGAVIYDSHDSYGNIQNQIDDALAFIQRNIRCAIVISDKAAHDRYWEYPIEALREALSNAICHRDYGLGNDIQIKVLEDRVVITNPGQLPFDMSLEDLEDPDHVSRPRNRLIAQAFYDMHIIEHYGSGIRRIKSACDGNGSPYPVWKNGGGLFQVKFPQRTFESAAKLGIDPGKLGLSPRLDDKSNRLGGKMPDSVCEQAVLDDKRTDLDDKPIKLDDKRVELLSGRLLSRLDRRLRSDAMGNIVTILNAIMLDCNLTIPQIEERTSLSHGMVASAIATLKRIGVLSRVGSKKTGHWELADFTTEDA